MSDEREGSLSQDEIEKLLSGTSDMDMDVPDIGPTIQEDTRTSAMEAEISILTNLMSQSVYYQASKFEKVYGKVVTHSNVKAGIKSGNQIINEIEGNRFIQMRMDYVEGIKGTNLIIVNDTGGLKLVEISSGQVELDLNESALTSFTELMGQVMGEMNSYFSRRFQRAISTASPQIEIAESTDMLRVSSGSQMIHISYNLNPEGEAPVKIHQIIDVALAKELINLTKKTKNVEDFTSFSSEAKSEKKKPSVTIRPVQYSNLEKVANIVSHGNIGLLLDIDMEVSVELGRTKYQIKDLLTLSEGNIIELDKQAGEPVDILVNDRLIATGEVMVMDETFGVRITQILESDERLETIL